MSCLIGFCLVRSGAFFPVLSCLLSSSSLYLFASWSPLPSLVSLSLSLHNLYSLSSRSSLVCLSLSLAFALSLLSVLFSFFHLFYIVPHPTCRSLLSLVRLRLPLPWFLSLPHASGASLRFRSAFSASASCGLRPLRFSMFVSLAGLHKHRQRHISARGIVNNLMTLLTVAILAQGN